MGDDFDQDAWDKGFEMSDDDYTQWQDDMEHGIEPDDDRNWDSDGNWIG